MARARGHGPAEAVTPVSGSTARAAGGVPWGGVPQACFPFKFPLSPVRCFTAGVLLLGGALYVRIADFPCLYS